MRTINIAGTAFEYLDVEEREQPYNGSYRRVLTVTCAADAIGLTEVNALLTEDNLASITLTNEEQNVTNIYDGYVLKLECGIKNEQVQAETPETAAVYADHLVFKLGKRTYIEEQLRKLGL